MARKRRLCLRQCLQQQGVGLRQVGADLQSAFRLCRRQARPAESRRAIVAIPLTKGSSGEVRSGRLLLLGDLELLEKRAGGKESPGPSHNSRGSGKTGDSERRL